MTEPLEGGMTTERYNELEHGPEPQRLTAEEMKAGWHWCWDWDGMLIHRDWAEFECCHCPHGERMRKGLAPFV